MIIATSLSGASILTDTAFQMLNFQNNTLSFVISIVLAILGIIYQFNQKESD